MLVGITGGMGSGKSALAQMLVDLGALRVDADAVAREVAADAEVAARLLAAFGGDLRDDAGHIDRRELGRRAFRTAEGSRRLEEIMRPPLAEAIECRLAAAEGVAAAAIVVFDAPLIFEWGTEGRCDRVVVVDAAEELRIERVRKRSGMAEGEIRERMARQMDPAQKKARADYVIDNNGDLAALHRQARGLWAELQARGGRNDE
ncbi:MAG: dephospho-CoA kinase [Gemmatimonadetes bacterium]|nr:dephospho-CoA kinase [Gemmatimonadota bacterium]